MVVLNPLVLVLSNGDCLPFHCNAQDARYKYSSFDGVGLWAGRRTCMRTVRHCIPSLLAPPVRSALAEEGGLAPTFS